MQKSYFSVREILNRFIDCRLNLASHIMLNESFQLCILKIAIDETNTERSWLVHVHIYFMTFSSIQLNLTYQVTKKMYI